MTNECQKACKIQRNPWIYRAQEICEKDCSCEKNECHPGQSGFKDILWILGFQRLLKQKVVIVTKGLELSRKSWILILEIRFT